jgi:hypothetical protein
MRSAIRRNVYSGRRNSPPLHSENVRNDMASKDEDILRDAIIATNKEIFNSAWGKDDDDEPLGAPGDRALEEMGSGLEGQHETEETEEGEEPEEAEATEQGESETPSTGTPPVEEPVEPKGRVPAGRLREEAERARAALAERDALKAQLAETEVRAKADREALQAHLDAAMAAFRQHTGAPQKPAEVSAPKPDLFEDPNAFVESLKAEMRNELATVRRELHDSKVNESIEAARARHGKAFDDAFGALKAIDYRNPVNVEMVKRMEALPNPGEAIVSWHKRELARREVGDDIEAYRKRIADETRNALLSDPEFRKEFVSSLRGEAEHWVVEEGKPRSKFPASLNRAPGSNRRSDADVLTHDGSPRAIFDSAWKT